MRVDPRACAIAYCLQRHCCMQVGQYQAAGKVLKESHPDFKLINGISDRVIDAVLKQDGGGYQVSPILSF